MTEGLLFVLSLCVVGLLLAVSILTRWVLDAEERLNRHEMLLKHEKYKSDYLFNLHMKDVCPEDVLDPPSQSTEEGENK